MNVLDSELVAAELLRAGYRQADGMQQANLILLNTCSVRQHAEDKIYSLLGRLKEVKEHRPELIIGVLGCMAQKDRHEILRRAPHVDLVVGPGQLGQLPALIETHRCRRWAAGRNQPRPHRQGSSIGRVEFCPVRAAAHACSRPSSHQAMVRIMFGCDKFCTYCVVPRVRGPEQSRPAAEIFDEVRQLADNGCLEVTLLGQTVNSYRDSTGPRTIELADLLYKLHDIDGLRRLRFVTNHPKHTSDALLQAMRDLPKVSPYLHVPAQSGSNAILQRMHRGYTVEFYREMLARIRETIPHAAITSDFIVGFCGETEEDFRQTADLVRDARFKNSFIFKYSGRPGTKAEELYEDDISEAVKRRRNNELLAIQNVISLGRQPAVSRPHGRDSRRGAKQGGEETGRGRERREEQPQRPHCSQGRGEGATCRANHVRPDRRLRGFDEHGRPHFAGDDREDRCVHVVWPKHWSECMSNDRRRWCIPLASRMTSMTTPTISSHRARRLAVWNGAVWAIGNGLASTTLVTYLAYELGDKRHRAWHRPACGCAARRGPVAARRAGHDPPDGQSETLLHRFVSAGCLLLLVLPWISRGPVAFGRVVVGGAGGSLVPLSSAAISRHGGLVVVAGRRGRGADSRPVLRMAAALERGRNRGRRHRRRAVRLVVLSMSTAICRNGFPTELRPLWERAL